MRKLRCLLAAMAWLALSACASIDWNAAAANSVASACNGSPSCKLRCPPGGAANATSPDVCRSPAAITPRQPYQ